MLSPNVACSRRKTFPTAQAWGLQVTGWGTECHDGKVGTVQGQHSGCHRPGQRGQHYLRDCAAPAADARPVLTRGGSSDHQGESALGSGHLSPLWTQLSPRSHKHESILLAFLLLDRSVSLRRPYAAALEAALRR